MKIEEYYERMIPKIKNDSNISPSEFTKLFDILLEINICDTIIKNKFRINKRKFDKEEITKYRESLIEELKKLNLMKGESGNGVLQGRRKQG